MSTWERRLYRASLRLLPAYYRSTHGAEIERLGEEYLDSHQHSGKIKRAFVLIALLAEAITGAVAAHASAVIWPGMWWDMRQDPRRFLDATFERLVEDDHFLICALRHGAAVRPD